MTETKKILLADAAQKTGLEPELILRFISFVWLRPEQADPPLFDEEDLCRAEFIHELQRDFGVNDAAIPIILHLVDQLHHLHGKIRDLE